MKKISIFLFVALFLTCAKAFSFSDTTFSLSGKINGYGNGIITINYSDPNERIKPDTVAIVNDSFRLEGSMPSPRMAFLKIMGNENLKKDFYRIDFVLDNEDVTIHADINEMSDYKLSGSKVTEKYKYILKEGQLLRSNFLDDMKAYDKIPKNTPEKQAKEKEVDEKREKYLSFMVSQKDFSTCDACAYTLYLMNRYIPWYRMEEILPLFDKKIDNNVYLKFLKKIVAGAARIQPGSIAADFKVKDLRGKEYSLSDFDHNQYLLLAFSASWCHPCKLEYPFLRKAFSTFNPKGLNVLIINLDEEKENWKKDVEEYKFPFPVLSDLNAFNGSITRSYGVYSIPKIFIISPEGKIVSNSVRGQGIIDALNKIYNKGK